MKKNILFVMALMLSMGTGVSWAGQKWQSQNPDPSEKPPTSKNPTDCEGKGTHTWCRTGQDDKALAEARSAQIPPTGNAGIRFGGVRSEYLKYSSLKPSGDRNYDKHKKH